MEPNEALLFWSRADGERVPLILGYGWDLNEDVVSWLVCEVGGSGQHQMGHLGQARICF